MNVCVAHLQMNACVAKNFGAWTEKVGHPCPTFMAHPTRVGRRVGALHKKLGHPCTKPTNYVLVRNGQYPLDFGFLVFFDRPFLIAFMSPARNIRTARSTEFNNQAYNYENFEYPYLTCRPSRPVTSKLT